MFLVVIHYKKPLEVVDAYLDQHRTFLETGYQKNYLITSGPRNPRSGGIILSQLKNQKELEEFLKNDPFLLYDIADYEIIEFNPVKFHKDFSCFV